jgi:hypothetical protein
MRTKEIFVTKSDGEIVNKKAVRQAWESVPPNGKFLIKTNVPYPRINTTGHVWCHWFLKG